jgi:mitochondrial cardiolipin hydrolase
MEVKTAFSPGDQCRRLIIDAIKQAEDTLDICVFTISDDRIAIAIKDAFNRGLGIRIISDNDKMLDLGSDIQDLANEGMEVRVDKTPFHMHHKFMIIDGKETLTGSYNWTRSAEEKNEENVVLINDVRTATSFQIVFEKLWEQCEVV